MSGINIDSLGLEYSIKMKIEQELGIPTRLIYNEIDTPKEFPQCYVRNVPSVHMELSKGRETIESEFNFEVILFSDSRADLNTLRQKVMKLLMFADIEFYSSDGEITDKKINTSGQIFESPVFASDIENVSSYYQVSYDFSIVTTYHKH